MMNPAKFGSPHLDTPNSRYDFCKFATKSVKTNKENHSKNPKYTTDTRSIHPLWLIAGARGQCDPTRQTHRAGARLD